MSGQSMDCASTPSNPPRPVVLVRMHPHVAGALPEGLVPSSTFDIETPPGRWQVEAPPGDPCWSALADEIQRVAHKIASMPASEVHFLGACPYSLATCLAHGLFQSRSHELVIHQQVNSPVDGAKRWQPWSERGPVLDRFFVTPEPLDPKAAHEHLQVQVSITHAVAFAEVPQAVQAAPALVLRPESGGQWAVPDARAARAAALEIEATIMDLAAQHPAATLHLFYVGPLGVLMLASRRLGLLSETSSGRPRLVLYERHKIEDGFRFWPAIAWPAGRVLSGDAEALAPGTKLADIAPPQVEHTPTPAIAKIHLWGEELREQEIVIQTATMGDAALKGILSAIERFGICVLRMDGMGPDKSLLKQLTRTIGRPAPRQNDFEGEIKSVIPEPTGTLGSGDSSRQLGLHVDGTQHTDTPALLAFHFVSEAKVGATSLFVDIARVLSDMPADERWQIISALAHPRAAVFEKKGMRYEGPIMFVATDRSLGVRVRFDEVIQPHAECRVAFERLRERCELEAYRLWLEPREGDLIIFDNRRLLHARDEVVGPRLREHWRMWIEELHTARRPDYLLGIRPVSTELLSEVRRRNGPNRRQG